MRPVKHKSIKIENDKEINLLVLDDCLDIDVFNCPKIAKIPDMCSFIWLETLKIQHCRIEICKTYFPSCLRNLEISYSCMKVFEPQHLPNNLAQINLSFNNLKTIPLSIVALNNNPQINLRNNDFWFNMYSDLSPAMIGLGVSEELGNAYKLNLISTSKVRYAIYILENKKLYLEAQTLARLANIQMEIRKHEYKTTSDNKQNVHLNSVQNTTQNSIEFIMRSVIHNDSSDFIDKALKDLKFDKNMYEKMLIKCNDETLRHDKFNVSFSDIFIRVMMLIYSSSDKETLLKILKDELEDGIDTCLTGQISRMVNALNGFVDGIKVSISDKEELSNSIIALRKRFAIIYSDPDEYISEAVPAVWQMLEDNCIPEIEHQIWLEYV